MRERQYRGFLPAGSAPDPLQYNQQEQVTVSIVEQLGKGMRITGEIEGLCLAIPNHTLDRALALRKGDTQTATQQQGEIEKAEDKLFFAIARDSIVSGPYRQRILQSLFDGKHIRQGVILADVPSKQLHVVRALDNYGIFDPRFAQYIEAQVLLDAVNNTCNRLGPPTHNNYATDTEAQKLVDWIEKYKDRYETDCYAVGVIEKLYGKSLSRTAVLHRQKIRQEVINLIHAVKAPYGNATKELTLPSE